MEDKSTENENKGKGCIIGVLVLVAIIFVPMIVGMVSSSVKDLKNTKHEGKLIEAGKIKTSNEVINEIVEVLKDRKEEELKKYLAEDFLYYDNNNRESKYLYGLLSDIKILSSSCDIEKRANDMKDEETYKIYWNTVEQNIKNGVKRGEHGYCLQTITIILKKIVKQDVITYEIEKIILRDA